MSLTLSTDYSITENRVARKEWRRAITKAVYKYQLETVKRYVWDWSDSRATLPSVQDPESLTAAGYTCADRGISGPEQAPNEAAQYYEVWTLKGSIVYL